MYSLKQRILAFIVAAMTAFSLGASVSATNLADIDRKVAAAEAEAAPKTRKTPKLRKPTKSKAPTPLKLTTKPIPANRRTKTT